MQNSHRGHQALPDEWAGLEWPRWGSYRVGLPGDEGATGWRSWVQFGHCEPPAWQWSEGALEHEGDVATYDPVLQAPEVFDAALHVVPNDIGSLLAFARQWGVLGVGSGLASETAGLATSPQGELVFDSVWATRRAFCELQRHFLWLRALRDRAWRSTAIPSLWADQDACLDAARILVPPPEHDSLVPHGTPRRLPTLAEMAMVSGADPYLAAFAKGHALVHWARAQVRPRDREEAHWRAFGAAITEHLRLIHPTIRWMDEHPIAAWRVRRLVDVLWAQLWNLATGGASIRQCRHCRRWFPVDHRGKVYCSRICTNRASAKASYQARKHTPKDRRRRR